MFTNGLLQLLLKIFNIEKNHEKYIPTRTNIYNDNKTTFIQVLFEFDSEARYAQKIS